MRRLLPILLALCLASLLPARALVAQSTPHNVVSAYDVVLQNAAAATGNGTAFSVGGLPFVAFQVVGTFSGTVTFEATTDGSTWVSLGVSPVSGAAATTTATAPGIFLANAAGIDQVRARVSVYTSGAITVVAKAVYNPGALLAAASGGGGGAVTIADGADVALGSTTDAAVGDATATLNAHARQIAKSLAGTLAVDTELSAGVAAADNLANPTVPQVLGHAMVWDPDGAVWKRIRARVPTNLDGLAEAGSAPLVAAHKLLFDGTNVWRERSNFNVSLLASSARTATTASADQTNINAKGVRVFLNVTAASGTGGLQVLIQDKDSVSSTYAALNATPTAVTATGAYLYILYPGVGAAAGGVTQSTSQVLPTTWRVSVTAGDASSYTYSVSASVLR